jgi:molybdate transport system substrate-binding protein
VLLPVEARADQALVAVAANFADALDGIAVPFEAETGHHLQVTIGSTGKLYAQIVAGAPFDVLLAADQERPARLEADGLTVPGSRFTYAMGALALWSADAHRIGTDGAAVLRAGSFRRLAIANPALAPYGAAAREALLELGLWEALAGRIVMGENIGQTHAMVATGNAELGLVALSQLATRAVTGSHWVVPHNLYRPIRQDAVLLSRAADNAAARALLEFLRRPSVRETIRKLGYATD